MTKQRLKYGEKILFSIFGAFFVLGIIAFIAMEVVRAKSEKPMFTVTTHFDFSPIGSAGSKIYREARCNSCHRALRSGTSMGLNLDGVGSKRSLQWLESFLTDPEKTYGAPTIDHGPSPKEAAYVSTMSKEDLRKIAVFLSELRADRGSAMAPQPPPERSGFIDQMVGTFAPESWKEKYQDIREKDKGDPAAKESQQQ
ncbi:MAG: cytochrome c [Gammaproteobacteria bacterium]|nr:cytochrome c [Gammaproteobacteria bacterium]